jgi:hypothetical protein
MAKRRTDNIMAKRRRTDNKVVFYRFILMDLFLASFP